MAKDKGPALAKHKPGRRGPQLCSPGMDQEAWCDEGVSRAEV